MFVWTLNDVVGIGVLVLFMVGAFLYGVGLAGMHLIRWANRHLEGIPRLWR